MYLNILLLATCPSEIGRGEQRGKRERKKVISSDRTRQRLHFCCGDCIICTQFVYNSTCPRHSVLNRGPWRQVGSADKHDPASREEETNQFFYASLTGVFSSFNTSGKIQRYMYIVKYYSTILWSKSTALILVQQTRSTEYEYTTAVCCAHNVQSRITIKPLRHIIAITTSPHYTDFSNRRLLHQHQRLIVFSMLGRSAIRCN
ncbi:hypothetical protein J3E69DRAFT_325835 [Trichoderma sp. SZMC 28015]